MWVPSSAAEIEAAALGGNLSESPSFDAKADLPQPKKNIDLAVDVAAMSTDGGTLLYGVGEDEHGRPTKPNPLTLARVGDRIGQIVNTSIAEVPFIDVREFESDNDPSKGYVVVLVPSSPRAPHQVTVAGDLRFYGRGAKGNRILTEGEVARLYERRQEWRVSADKLLAEIVASSDIEQLEGVGYLHAFCRPIPPDPEMFERASAILGDRKATYEAILGAVHTTKLRGKYNPSLEQAAQWHRFGPDEWRFSNYLEEARRDAKHIGGLSEVRIALDGRARLFCGRATDSHSQHPGPLIIEAVIAGNVEAFLAIMGRIYETAAFLGQIDVGVAVTNIKGAESFMRSQNWYSGDFTYNDDMFSRTARVAAAELLRPHEVAHRLLRHFYEATSGREGLNLFTDENAA